jgi:hypothetical protein
METIPRYLMSNYKKNYTVKDYLYIRINWTNYSDINLSHMVDISLVVLRL